VDGGEQVKYNLNYTFERNALTCWDCPFYSFDERDNGYCTVTNTSTFRKRDFKAYRDRFNDCPITEVDE
jgi:hypothetical protein